MDNSSENQSYLIWGMGLLGTSLALDLMYKRSGKQSQEQRVQKNNIFGVVRSQKNISILKNLGIQNVVDNKNPIIQKWISQVDGIIIGTPVEAIPTILQYISTTSIKKDAFITDVSSTKSKIMQWIEKHLPNLPFVGSHPMCGSDFTGPENGQRNLFQNSTIYITKSPVISKNITDAHYDKIVQRVCNLWKQVHADPFFISYNVHDKWAAYLSHGLHLIACIIPQTLNKIPQIFDVPSRASGGSFRDITRVVESNPKLWEGIIGSNKEEIIDYLNTFQKLIKKLKEQLINDTLSVEDTFLEAANIRKKINSKKV